ncbi:MAG TPA: SBBP repeat-containing protein [Bryobacteraceae bacterium]|nr:SBBP repeat-containing protein [Bryobacteraceae bacterium]
MAFAATAQTPAIYPLDGATPAAVATDSQGNIYVVGQTSSTGFPVTANALQPTLKGGTDAFVAKLSAAGALVWSTYFGGSNNDSAAGVALDSAGNVLVTGQTYSTDLPVMNAYQATLGGRFDAFVLKLDPTGKMVYSTYLGGSQGDSPAAIATDGAGAAYIAGYTESSNFPGQTSISSTTQGFVVKLSANGSLAYSYEPANAVISAIAVDASGSAYIAGNLALGNTQAFVLKLSPDGSKVTYQKDFGASQATSPTAIAIDATGSAYVAGNTTSVDFPVVNPVQPTLGARPLWKSTDGGNTWTPIDNLPFAVVQALVDDPAAPQTLYAAASDTGAFKSIDGGKTWTAIDNGIAERSLSQMAIPPSNPSTLFAGTSLGHVYRTTDGGADWSLVESFPGAVTGLAIDPQKPSTVYTLSPQPSTLPSPPPDTVSKDDGATWNAFTPAPFGIVQFLVDPVTEGTLYAYSGATAVCCFGLVQSMLYRSTDGGATWQDMNVGAPLPAPVADPTTKPATIYAGSGARSSDGGNTWVPLTPPPAIAEASTTAMATDPQTGAVYIAGGSSNGRAVLDVSHDHGQSWTQLNTPAQMPPISGITATPGALYATSNSAFYSGFLLKLSPDGSTVTYATYLGGHGGPPPFEVILSNQITGLALDQAGNMVVTGDTLTPDFPTVNAAQTALTGSVDGFLTVISADGQKIDYSTYLGGNNGAQASAVAIDPQGNPIVVGNTSSPSMFGTAIPLGGFVAKLSVTAPAPTPVITKVVSAASFQAPIEAGSWVMIQGTDLANSKRLWQTSDFNGNNLPTTLDGVSVTIDGIPAYVEYISPTQINVQAPMDSATGTVNVVVTNNGHSSAPATAQLQSVAPALFMTPTYNAIASTLPNYTPITSAAPAMPGDLVVLWCTGLGPTNPTTPAGVLVSGAPATATLPVVTVGGMQVPVISSVMTPGEVGLYQITVQLPANVPTGTPEVKASVGSLSTQAGVTLYVGPQ